MALLALPYMGLTVSISTNKPTYFVVTCSYKLEDVGSLIQLRI
jgi:hypothetical protein